MDEKAARIATVCECIDHCFAFEVWCRDFAQHEDPDEMVIGLGRGHELVSDATLLLSFLALRRVDEFLRGKRSNADDLIASDIGIDPANVICPKMGSFLTKAERTNINKGAAHLTQWLMLDADSEVDLAEIVIRSVPTFTRLTAELRANDDAGEAARWLDGTDELLAGMAPPRPS
ncbi:hypothetical protein LNKW23_17800 [Paralimibaculum aggregatum]|uniref:Uncharacterized protein n=1 Tax=Paralimibaculum aggregatum TaxID=3036245 RepID=A0ABQ6LLM9_9RHOB|nr:hypothetical protein [Limibaculum sp. NKW23]GMG82567.1 hypothetical protein LNKW23_17800 [Limibaculum sp. NKW23]